MTRNVIRKGSAILLVFLCLFGFTACRTSKETISKQEKPLTGKLISVIGDSISTFAGVSDDKNVNSTLGANASWYKGNVFFDRDGAWWQQAADAVGAEILVNNSWSGSCAYFDTRGEASRGFRDRCVNLHDNEGREPDIIAVYLGTNDFPRADRSYSSLNNIDYENLVAEDGSYKDPTSFEEGYALMLARMKHRYPNAEIYCFTTFERATYKDDTVVTPTFNNVIKTIAEKSGAYVVDLYSDSGITGDPLEYATYIVDAKLHPNRYGMDAISGCFVSAMYQNSRYMPDDFKTCSITYDLNGVVVREGTAKLVAKGDALEMTFRAEEGVSIKVTVTMGGKDVTSKYYSDNTIKIPKITGDITIKAFAE